MKLFLLNLSTVILIIGCKEKDKPAVGHNPKDKWQLAWQDEFDQDGLPDSTKWDYDTGGHGWGNNELQFYTAKRNENTRIENGHLIIEARKENWGSSKFTSARLVTRGKASWQYGRVEVKARIPSGRGTWPAIWMLADKYPLVWPDDGEIDIMEHVGYNQGYIHSSIHTKKFNHIIGTQKTDTIFINDCSDSFHVYTVEWNKDSLSAFVDDKQYFKCYNDQTGYDAWPFDNKMYLLLNIAVGGNWGGQKGVDESIFPKRMEIDYVRVYQKD